MLRLTRKQIIFLAVYPLIHILISVPFFLMAICTGLGPPDVGDPPISAQQEIVSRIGHHVIDTLWAPTFFLMHSLKLSRASFMEYLWLLLSGLLYGFFLLIKSLLSQLRHPERSEGSHFDEILRPFGPQNDKINFMSPTAPIDGIMLSKLGTLDQF